jgi:CheY-like chemotaxis protein
VRDTGVGMDAETRARAFEPFFTTKPVGDGSGLGLAMVYGIAQQSGGRARLDSEPGAGTTVVVEFPRATRGGPGGAPEGAAARPAAAGAAGASDARPAPAPEVRTVLLVEDETMVRVLGRRILEAAGYRVLEAVNGAEGLERWRERRTEIDVVVSDVRMPVLDGHALAAALRAEATDVPVLLVSGYSEHEVAPGGARAGFLEKPYTAASLLGALAALGVAPRR